MGQSFNFHLDENGIGHLVFDIPGEKVNKLWFSELKELEEIIDQLAQRKDIKALVIASGKEDVFIAGADLSRFGEVFQDPQKLTELIKQGHRTFNKLQDLPFPTIACIHGACLGGGTEAALSCTYRVMTDSPKTVIGLPETSLGIIPGWGGTQRMPRLVGLREALSLILSGRSIKAQKAYKIHLGDALIANEFRKEKLTEFVQLILTAEGQKKILEGRNRKGILNFLLEGNPLGRAFIFWKAEKDVLAKTKGQYPAPLKALKVIKESYGMPLNKGLEKEIHSLLKVSKEEAAISKNLIQLFFTSEALKKDTGVQEEVATIKIHTAAVLGAGTMGSGIAWLLTYYNISVRMRDIDLEAIGRGFGSVKRLYDQYVREKRQRPLEASLKFQRLSATTELTGLKSVNLVIEAAIENLEIKNRLFAEVENKIPAHALLASNTSSLSISKMAKNLQHPERFIGMHFFNPVNRMPLVEIIPGEKTSAQTIATAVEVCKSLGKTPIVVGDCAGFLVNRIFMNGAEEAIRLLEEGVPHEKIDKMMLKFGFPMPPFLLADEVGNDVSYKVAQVLEEAYGERMSIPPLLKKIYECKLFGKKAGRGFYLWKGKDKAFNKDILTLIGPQAGETEMPEEEMHNRVILLLINEAARCLAEKIITRPAYLDMALIMGTGFPPFRGGLLRYADQIGVENIVRGLERLEKKYGVRFAPAAHLLNMQSSRTSFYPGS